MRKICIIVVLTLAAVLRCACSDGSSMTAEAKECYEQIESLSIAEGELHFLGQAEKGSEVWLFQDSVYNYTYDIAKGKLKNIFMLDILRDEIVSAGFSNRKFVEEETVLRLVEELFPWTDTSSLSFKENTGSGSPLEAHIYTVYEYVEDVRLNTLMFSFSADGRLTFANATHNQLPDNTVCNIDVAKASEIALEFLKADPEKMNQIEAMKLVLDGRVVWFLECVVEYGEMDGYAHIYIDIESGEIVREMSTSAG